jgi:hypothetical protein
MIQIVPKNDLAIPYVSDTYKTLSLGTPAAFSKTS